MEDIIVEYLSIHEDEEEYQASITAMYVYNIVLDYVKNHITKFDMYSLVCGFYYSKNVHYADIRSEDIKEILMEENDYMTSLPSDDDPEIITKYSKILQSNEPHEIVIKDFILGILIQSKFKSNRYESNDTRYIIITIFFEINDIEYKIKDECGMKRILYDALNLEAFGIPRIYLPVELSLFVVWNNFQDYLKSKNIDYEDVEDEDDKIEELYKEYKNRYKSGNIIFSGRCV